MHVHPLHINQELKETMTITPFDILDAFKDIKCGKSCCVDDISDEHFVCAIRVLFSLLLFCITFTWNLPDHIMKTAIVLYTKNTTGYSSEKKTTIKDPLH